MDKVHKYRASITWTGNLGGGTSSYTGYNRDHDISGREKATPIAGSSDPSFRGDPKRYNPEELLVASLSACHMLWVLHLCAVAGIVVIAYSDEAEGAMTEHADGSGEFVSVGLNPVVTLSDSSREGEMTAIDDKAHSLCFIARSVRFPVQHSARVKFEHQE